MGGECSDINFYCPNGNIMTIGQCYDGSVGCETCGHFSGTPRWVKTYAWDSCNMGSSLTCDRSTWENRADGCSAGPWTGGDFIEACDMHDLCYASGTDQNTCDTHFYNNILDATGDSVAATSMHIAVSATDNSGNVNWGIENCKAENVPMMPFNEVHEIPMAEAPNINVYSLIGYNIFGYYILDTTIINISLVIFALFIGIFTVYGLKKICKKNKRANKYKRVKFESTDESYDEQVEQQILQK